MQKSLFLLECEKMSRRNPHITLEVNCPGCGDRIAIRFEKKAVKAMRRSFKFPGPQASAYLGKNVAPGILAREVKEMLDGKMGKIRELTIEILKGGELNDEWFTRLNGVVFKK